MPYAVVSLKALLVCSGRPRKPRLEVCASLIGTFQQPPVVFRCTFRLGTWDLGPLGDAICWKTKILKN